MYCLISNPDLSVFGAVFRELCGDELSGGVKAGLFKGGILAEGFPCFFYRFRLVVIRLPFLSIVIMCQLRSYEFIITRINYCKKV